MREYWTYLENSNNHYMISNFGRIMNAKSQRIHNGSFKKKNNKYNGTLIYIMRYGIEKYVNIGKEVYKHFMNEPVNNNEYIIYFDGNPKNNSILNIGKTKESNRGLWERHKDSLIKKDCCEQNKLDVSVWEELTKTISLIVKQQWKNACYRQNIEQNDLINEALLLCVENYSKFSQEKIGKFCRDAIRQAYNDIKSDNCYNIEDYQIGINYKK